MEAHVAVVGLIVRLLRLCCPYQPEFSDIPVVECDISLGLEGYHQTMRLKKLREQALSPFFVGYHHNIPVTPFDNPRTGLSSFHIIRLVNPVDGKYRVDLLIRDTDLYFVAFRRELIFTEEEEREQGMVGGWGRWHKFKTEEVPDFLNARDIGISSSYGRSEYIRPGGAVTLDSIYHTLGGFGDSSAVGPEVRKAVHCAMIMFCESSRLRSVFVETSRRIQCATAPEILHEHLWDKIKKWGQLCGVALDYKLNNILQAEVDLPVWCLENHGLASVDSLVGAKGEVMLIKIDTDKIGVPQDDLDDLLTARTAGFGQEPGFQEP